MCVKEIDTLQLYGRSVIVTVSRVEKEEELFSLIGQILKYLLIDYSHCKYKNI
jgi:hypothetical protein